STWSSTNGGDMSRRQTGMNSSRQISWSLATPTPLCRGGISSNVHERVPVPWSVGEPRNFHEHHEHRHVLWRELELVETYPFGKDAAPQVRRPHVRSGSKVLGWMAVRLGPWAVYQLLSFIEDGLGR